MAPQGEGPQFKLFYRVMDSAKHSFLRKRLASMLARLYSNFCKLLLRESSSPPDALFSCPADFGKRIKNHF